MKRNLYVGSHMTSNPEFRDNYDATFRKKEMPVSGRGDNAGCVHRAEEEALSEMPSVCGGDQ